MPQLVPVIPFSRRNSSLPRSRAMQQSVQEGVTTVDDVSAALRRIRQARGLMQFQAAAQFAETEWSWSRYENAKSPVPLDLIVAVALRWNAPQLLAAHPAVAAYRAMSGDYDPRDPAPMARVA